MDWQAAIGRQGAALLRVVAGLVAMVGAGAGRAADAADLAADRPTLARHRHRALLRLVRPAEAAARRLVIALALAGPDADADGPDTDGAEAARAGSSAPDPADAPDRARPAGHAGGSDASLPHPRDAADTAPSAAAARIAPASLSIAGETSAPVAQPPAEDAATDAAAPAPRRRRRPHPPKPSPTILRNGVGTGIVLSAALAALVAAAPDDPSLPAWLAGAFAPPLPRILRLPLTDPERRERRRRPPSRSRPGIFVPGAFEPPRPPARTPPSPDDRLDATRLVLRIRALAAALDDLPGEVRRFRRWQIRHAARLARERAAQAEADARAAAEAAEAARLAASGIRIVRVASLGIAGIVHPPPPAPRRWRRVSPLRLGRPPGCRRKPRHEVDDILWETDWLARQALRRLDTS